MEKIEQNIDEWCNWCGDGMDKSWAEDWSITNQCDFDAVVTIIFCPMCGRQLTEGE